MGNGWGPCIVTQHKITFSLRVTARTGGERALELQQMAN